MINIAKLLKDCPAGTKLYSPLFGEVTFCRVEGTNIYVILDRTGCGYTFSEHGKPFKYPNAECLLFPSKDYRTWEGWKVPVQPEFNLGDWVVRKNGETFSSGNYAEQITLIEVGGKGKCIWLSSTSWINEDDIRLWTIADAKDGDVLATYNIICIFKKLDKDGYYIISPCIYTVKGGLEVIDDENDSIGSCGFKPATKEDRELLFRKMKEAGYEWDADKKEVCKIIEPKFKVGDSLQSGCMYAMVRRIDTENQRYVCQFDNVIPFKEQNLWSLVPNPKPHYDIDNFHAGMPVLVRILDKHKWCYLLFSHCYKHQGILHFHAGGAGWLQCIPFNKDTEHLLGTTDMCDEQYINW